MGYRRKPEFLEKFALYPDIEISEKTEKKMTKSILGVFVIIACVTVSRNSFVTCSRKLWIKMVKTRFQISYT
jgi:hypothetical protein